MGRENSVSLPKSTVWENTLLFEFRSPSFDFWRGRLSSLFSFRHVRSNGPIPQAVHWSKYARYGLAY